MAYGTFASPDLTTFCDLDDLGLVATGQLLEPDRAVLECRVANPDPWCRRCGSQGLSRGTITRTLAHTPYGHRPTTLLLRVRRYHCRSCGTSWRDDTTRAAPARGKLTHGGMRWALTAVVVDHLSISRVAAGLGVAWNTANQAVLEEGYRLLISDPARFEGVRVIGVDEHVWRHTGRGERYVTVIIDLTPIREGSGPSRLLDMVPGRSKQVLKTWLADRPQQWRDGIEVVAMDGFTGYKTATSEELPQAIAVMDPFHVIRLAGDAVETCRRRIQQQLTGRRGRKTDPLYAARRLLLTGTGLLTPTQRVRLDELLAKDEHAEVEATWVCYQNLVAAYRESSRELGRFAMERVITPLRESVPAQLPELRKLGRTLNQRIQDILAYFDLPGTSNGPTEAINGRLEHLRGSALGFRNLTHYIARSLLEAGGFRPHLHPQM
ncbi:ISL3 family transposase [Brachybacterium sp. UMB0905]|uniref:ISL3 family transposase n=3 Tax=unclassified Brachybacterium TaxID=2623841 RepID=UPI000C80EC51|nr:ISL3 family transposase [Brachybacterium sp. UMB0905]PMC76884.1 ISL3 family transposase [Brachybacterium sp. UMB0905]